jgi:hypothetical protein
MEDGSNTSNVTLRVVGGEKNWSLKSKAEIYGYKPHFGLDTKTVTDWPTDRQSQCDFDFD